MLAFPKEIHFLIQLINRVNDSSTTMRKFFPVNIRLGSDLIQDVIEVLLDCLNLDISHVEKLILESYILN